MNSIIEIGNMKFDLSEYLNRQKAAALCRIIGYLITDGSSKNHGQIVLPSEI